MTSTKPDQPSAAPLLQLMTPLNLALSYTANAWPVFPCRSKEEFDSLTGEFLAPKTPLTSNGLKSATLNERIVREWWRRSPDAAVGIPTGKATGVFVLDVDNKPGGSNGFDWLYDMEAEHGALPTSARVSTPNGGLHILFNYVPGTRNRGALGDGVDLRSEGGYVLAGGSVMADGRAYTWQDGTGPDTVEDAPTWLIDLIMPAPVPERPANYQPRQYTGENAPYVNAAIDRELSDLAVSPAGNRNNRLNDAAFALGQFVGAGALSRSDVESELEGIAGQWPNLTKSRGTIRNGLDAGQRQPREIPEPQHSNDNTRLVDISRMIANGLAKARAASDTKPLTPTEESEDKSQDKSPDMTPSRDISAINDPPTLQSPAAPIPAIVATPFEWVDPKTLARREFVYGTHYIRKYVSVTSSPGGLGKTSNSIVEALSMATHRPLLGTKPPAAVKVWLFNAEDPRDEMERRIMAACIHYRLKPDDLTGRLFLDTGREQELVVAIDDKKGVRIQQPIVEAVVQQIKSNGIDVMIIDPFVSTHRVNENDNGAIDAVAKLWGKIADETNCAIDVVHHIRKVSDRDATVEDSRGAVSLISAARSARILNQMSADQAKEASINPDDRFSFFNVNSGKSNMTVRSGRVDWRKLVSVPLGNGRGLTKPQDHAGVVTGWKWPSTEEIVGETAPNVLEAIKTLVDNGSYKEKANAKPWVGEAVAYVLGQDVDDKATRKKIGLMLQQWFADGHFHVAEERDHVNRRNTLLVRSSNCRSEAV